MTIDEEIVRTLRRLETLSRRNPKEAAPAAADGHAHHGHHEHHGQPAPEGTLPMTPPESRHHGRGRMLASLNDCGSMSQAQLAAQLDIRPQSLSELLSKAEADGLVTRKQSEEDKRQIIVTLTEAGSARVAGFREAHRRRAEEFLSPLTEEEKEQLASLLGKLVPEEAAESQEEEPPAAAGEEQGG